MTDATDSTITVRVDDDIVFRLREGRRPLVYPDSITRVSYESGIGVIHTGTVWRFGEAGGVKAVELDDGTVVAVADIDPESVSVEPPDSLEVTLRW